MTDFGVHKAYTARVHSVCMILAVVLCVSGAQAGAWEEFERRCLVPMEEIEASPLDDVQPLLETDGLDSILGVLVPEQTNFRLDRQDYSMLISVSENWHAKSCVVGGTTLDASLALETHFLEWKQAAISKNTYRPNFTGELGEELVSTDWREPLLSLSSISKDERFVVALRETDLES